MPQLDLESMFCVVVGESRSKVACETIALFGSDAGSQYDIISADAHANDADAPEESHRIRIAGGIGWAELAGAVLERDDSTKGSSNPKAAAAAAATRKGEPRPDARRLPTGGKTAVVIGVLPAGKMVVQKRRSLGRGWRRPATGARFFAREVVETEPASPKVSCFGAVRSESRAAAPAPPEKEQEEERSGRWARLTAALHDLCRSNNRRDGQMEASESKATAPKSPSQAALSQPRPVVGLGDLKRLASRRWPETIVGAGRGSV